MTTGLIVLLLCLIGARLAWESYQDHRERHLQHAEETAAQRASSLEEFLIGRITVLQGIAASPAVRELDYDGARDYLTSAQIGSLGFTGGLALVDLEGGLRVDGLQRQPDPAPGEPPAVSYADRPHFQRVIATGRPAIAPALTGRITPQPLLSIAVPVADDQGNLVAVLIGGSRLDDAGSVLSRHAASLEGRLIIVDQAGQVIADDGPVETLEDISSHPLLSMTADSAVGHVSDVTGLGGEPDRLVGFATIPTAGWTVFWEQSERALLRDARIALVLQLVGLAFAWAGATGAAWLVGRRLDRQQQREREAAAAVAASERQVRDFANRLPVLAWTRPVQDNRHDDIDFANSTMREFITGKPEGDFSPGFYETSFDAELSARLRDDVVRTGAGGEVEVRLRRFDDVPRAHLLRVEPVLGENGKVVRLICTATDIEDLRRAQQQFQMALASVAAGERSFRDFADSIPVLAWRQVQRGGHLHMEFANARYREYETGQSEGEIAGTLPHHPDDEQLIRQSLEEATASGNAAELEARLRRWDGEYHWHLLRLVPIKDEGSGFTEWVGGATDIQQLKETEAALQEAIRAKDDFLGLVSHELRTPLQQVLGNAEILIRRGHTYSPEVQRESLHEIWVQGRRLQRLVENMLAISRLERGVRMEAEPHLVQRLLDRTLAEFRDRFPEVELRVDVQPDAPPVAVDPTAVDQVLWNLLTNAVKYGGEGTPIDLTIGEEDDGWVSVAVHDRGKGLSEEEIAEVFEPFVRSQSTQAAAGLGLGLSVCRRLMESHGGEMWARSREGGGMSFGFRMPRIDEEFGDTEAEQANLTAAPSA